MKRSIVVKEGHEFFSTFFLRWEKNEQKKKEKTFTISIEL